MLKVGSEAPDFDAPLVGGGTFQLAAHRERQPVVLYFFPKAFTAG